MGGEEGGFWLSRSCFDDYILVLAFREALHGANVSELGGEIMTSTLMKRYPKPPQEAGAWSAGDAPLCSSGICTISQDK